MKTEEKLMNPAVKMPETESLEERNKNLVRQAAEEIYNKGNYALIDEIVSNDFVIHSLNPNKEIHGREGARKFVIALRTAFPDIKFIIKDQFAEGDKVVTHFMAEGTHQGNFQGIPPTGKSFKVSAIDIDYIKSGKVSDCWSNLDELSLLQQLGIVS
jgi:steroid delta-isomerase-like uncharacterized protein